MSGALIVGSGQAAVQAALSLRDGAYPGEITIVGSEPYGPYQRPPLSKDFLTGKATADSLQFRKPEYYERNDIGIVRNVRVVSLALAADGAPRGHATLQDGSTRTFDDLLLAVGGRPRKLSVPGADLKGVCYLRGIADAVELSTLLDDCANVVVVGGGFIGLEAAAAARARDRNVTVVELDDRLLSRTVAREVSGFLAEAHIRRGVTVLLGAGVTALEGEGQVSGVRLANGELLPADLVVVGIGMVPRTELAEQLGLTVKGGIVVDGCMRTSDPRVHAAGDCAVAPDPISGDAMVRLESVQNAVDQAKAAAASILGRPVQNSALPWFWSTQGDLRLQMAGLATGYDQVVYRGQWAEEKISAFYYRDGRLTAVHSINRPQDYMVGRRTLSSRMTIDPALVVGDAKLAPAP